jgi:hypothetical protein
MVPVSPPNSLKHSISRLPSISLPDAVLPFDRPQIVMQKITKEDKAKEIPGPVCSIQ